MSLTNRGSSDLHLIPKEGGKKGKEEERQRGQERPIERGQWEKEKGLLTGLSSAKVQCRPSGRDFCAPHFEKTLPMQWINDAHLLGAHEVSSAMAPLPLWAIFFPASFLPHCDRPPASWRKSFYLHTAATQTDTCPFPSLRAFKKPQLRRGTPTMRLNHEPFIWLYSGG